MEKSPQSSSSSTSTSTQNPKSHSHHTNPNSTYSQDRKTLCQSEPIPLSKISNAVLSHEKESPGQRVAMAVPPERWGKEGSLKEWIDGATFDALWASNIEAAVARESLLADAERKVVDDPGDYPDIHCKKLKPS